LPFVANNPADPAGGLPVRPRPRRIEPEAERSLPPAAGMPRVLKSPWSWRRRGLTILSYLFILVACLMIAAIGYTTFTFSRYQNVILPNVYISSVPVGDDTRAQADVTLFDLTNAGALVPIQFTFHGHIWTPTIPNLQLKYDLNATIAQAYSIGRTGNIWQNFLDRLPIRRHSNVRVVTYYTRSKALAWIKRKLVTPVQRPMINAWLAMENGHAVAELSQTGRATDTKAALRDIISSRGSLTVHRFRIPVITRPPAITDSAASAEASRINAFLRRPPVFHFGRTAAPTSGATLAGMISILPRPAGSPATSDFYCRGNGTRHIVTDVQASLCIDRDTVYGYAEQLIWPPNGFDIPPQAPRFDYLAGDVRVVSAGQTGRSANWGMAANRLLHAFQTLTPGAQIRIPVRTVPRPRVLSNPASVGVTTLLGEGQTSFAGSPSARIADMQSIATQLNGILVKPGVDISLNYYVNRGLTGTGWRARVYNEGQRLVGGQTLPAQGGAMDQVATTFFRAGYAAGLQVLARYSHVYRLPWYQPPGMDAVVSTTGSDLQFRNNTGGYLLVETRFEPIQQTLYVYIYGRKTGWSVNIGTPVITKRISPGPAIRSPDPILPLGKRLIVRAADPGGDYRVTRTVTMKRINGSARTVRDTINTDYLPRPALVLVGTAGPTPRPTPTLPPTPTPTPTPVVTPTPAPTATPAPTPTSAL
jgi:vancomycin resistance protein YoaR